MQVAVAGGSGDWLEYSVSQTPAVLPNSPTCEDSQIEAYVNKLGVPELTNSGFESLIKCGGQSILSLATAINSENSDVRGSAAYALGEIRGSLRGRLESPPEMDIAYKWISNILEKRTEVEKNPDVLKILQNYEPIIFRDDHFSSFDKRRGLRVEDTRVRVLRLEDTRDAILAREQASSPLICALPGISKIFPRCL
jgi:hypothetical protein